MNWPLIAGISIILLLAGAIFAAIAADLGWFGAVMVFVLTAVIVGLTVAAVTLIGVGLA